jgi:hypothetical protein
MGCGTSKPDPSTPMNAQPVAGPNSDAWAAKQYEKDQKKKKAVSLVQFRCVWGSVADSLTPW